MNSEDNREDELQTEPLEDLSLTGEQAEETKAGTTVTGSSGTFRLTFNGATT